MLTTQDGTESIPGNALTFEVEFADRRIMWNPAAHAGQIPIGSERRLFIPFDTLRRGEELVAFRVRATGATPVLIRSLDIGLVKDPVATWTENFAAVQALGNHRGQIGFGTDISGFEALIPFSAVSANTTPPTVDEDCAGRTPGAPCPGSLPTVPLPPRPRTGPYSLDVELVAGRPDPARSNPALSVFDSLAMARVDADPGRWLDFRESGLSTIGQLPDFAVAAANADAIRTGRPGTLGPDLFQSVDGLVRAWEILDTAHASGVSPDRARCRR